MSSTDAQSSADSRRQVVLCDVAGRPGGTAEIVAAHTGDGLLHLAFSVYLFSPDRRSVLLQQRSAQKMLWPLVWANTCCSHPRPGEGPVAAAHRRLKEEMGIAAELNLGPTFVYRAEDPAGRGVEHEYDQLLFGTFDGEPLPDPAEVANWAWINVDELRTDLVARPDRYAPWLHAGLPRLLSHA